MTPRLILVLYLHFGAEPELGLSEAYLAERSHEFVTVTQLPIVED